MNERIKELALQAGLDNIDRISAVIDVEKFAELIIQKCAMIGNYAYDGENIPVK